MASSAAATDDNQAFVTQESNGHTALITQSGSNNRAGQSGANLGVLQRSEFTQLGNTLTITQSGDNNVAGDTQVLNRGGSIHQLNQSGPGSAATFTQSSNDNVIGQTDQVARTASATGNTLTIIQQGGDGNEITRVRQDRSGSVDGAASGRLGHNATITQNGASNLIALVDQGSQFNNSSDNGLVATIQGDSNGRGALSGVADIVDDSSFIQAGTSNRIEFSITNGDSNQFGFSQNGSNNQALTVEITGDLNELGVSQTGSDNVVNIATIEGDANIVGLTQNGDANRGDLTLIGVSDRNAISLTQLGSNVGIITVEGSDNAFDVSQDGVGNTAEVSIIGDFNGSPTTFGVGGDAASIGLFSGDINQVGDDNNISFDIGDATTAGANNAFAFQQTGDNNAITGSQIGDGNQVAIAQIGNGNTASFAQLGNGNNLGVVQ